MKSIYILSFAVSALLPALSVSASEDDYLAESDFFGESPIVLTVSRLHKPLDESPASVSIIDRQMIRNSGARELADIFRMVPGFIVGYQSGHQPVVTYQGLGTLFQRQLQVLIDGRSVFIPSFGGVPWTNLPLLLEDIERVEITRGPNAVTYGANAFLATINIITRHAAEDLGGEIIYSHDLDNDSNVQDFYARYGNNYGDLDWRISAGREKDDGYSNINDSKILEKLNIRTDFLTDYNQFWTIQAGINQSREGKGDGGLTDRFRISETSNSFQNIKWELVEDTRSTTVLLTHTHQKVKDNYLTDPLNEFLAVSLGNPIFTTLDPFTAEVNFDRVSDRTDFEIFQSQNLNPQTQLVYGGSIREDVVQSKYLFNDLVKYDVDTKRLFTSIEWKSKNDFIVDFGIMLEDTNLTKREVSQRLSLLKKIDQHNLRFVTSTANRNPVLYEVIGETQFEINLPPGLPPPFDQPFPLLLWRATGNLDPETIQSTEIGLFSEYFNRQLNTDIKIFHYSISDQISDERITLTPDPITGFDQSFDEPINGMETRVEGIELSFNYSPTHKQYRLYGGLSRIYVLDSFSDFEPSFPDYSGFIGGHYNFNRDHQLSSTWYTVADISWADAGDRVLDSYNKLDLRYQYTLDHQHDLNLEIIGYNLIEDYDEYFLEVEQQRSVIMRLSGKF